MSDKKNHAVIIPHYNDVTRLGRCLEALQPQLDDTVEVIVADNASTVDLSPIRAEYPDVAIVVQPQKGAGPARNKGVAESTAPWLLFIDADCVPAPDWLAVGRRIAQEGAVIGGRVDVFHETPPPKSGAEAFEEVFAFKMQAYLERDAFLGAGNLVTSRAVFEAVGGFRPAVSEDKDWSQRAARAGFTLKFENAFAAKHPSRQDWPALRHKWRRLSREDFLLNVAPIGETGGMGQTGRWVLKALAMPLSAFAHAPRILRCDTLSGPEKLRALGILFKLRHLRMFWMLKQVIVKDF